MRRTQRIAQEYTRGQLPPPIVYEKGIRARRVWPLYASFTPQSMAVVCSDGRQEYMLHLPRELMSIFLGTKVGVRTFPRPEGLPTKTLMALAERQVIGPRWLKDEIRV